MHAVVDVAVWLVVDEPVGLYRAVADVHHPVLVEPAGVAGAPGESEVGPIPTHLPRCEREQAGGCALARVRRPTRQPIDDCRGALKREPQTDVAGSLNAATEK